MRLAQNVRRKTDCRTTTTTMTKEQTDRPTNWQTHRSQRMHTHCQTKEKWQWKCVNGTYIHVLHHQHRIRTLCVRVYIRVDQKYTISEFFGGYRSKLLFDAWYNRWWSLQHDIRTPTRAAMEVFKNALFPWEISVFSTFYGQVSYEMNWNEPIKYYHSIAATLHWGACNFHRYMSIKYKYGGDSFYVGESDKCFEPCWGRKITNTCIS